MAYAGSAGLGNTYNQGFIGPIRPQDKIAPQGFIGPTLGTPPVQQSNGGGAPIQQNNPQPQQQSQPAADPYAQLRSNIGSGWDQYLGSLNDIGNTYLPQQQAAQNNIADSQFSSGQDTINTQKAKSLRDIATNTKNAFQAGNVFLGSHGAGDSSAADQYSFAINQNANKQTGQLNEYTNSQLNQLKSQHDQQVQGIAQWFSQQQQAIKQAVASGQLSKSQDINNLSRSILDQAIQATNALKSNTQNQYNALLSWAANNSQNLGQLQSNIAGIPHALGTPQIDSTGNFQQAPVGFGAGNTQKTDIFGNPIQ